ncbi:hypothetical protein FGIG_10775 [Fasciola gigantica]|uniref:Uncharacterized protein n=1 Tax=Fasciola gigantica TaxID=46835 RepID=A0A504Y6Z6_FASGI|nr:hypothetical protein FGIG_10775 [Fasciola gigantica]
MLDSEVSESCCLVSKAALHHLGYSSNWNALDTLKSVVLCLPVELRGRRAVKAERIYELDRQATFEGTSD